MMRVVMKLDNVGKVFRQYQHEIYRILQWFSITSPIVKEKWVLRNISFNLEAGQALGIVGRNGAGKSTLLKLISGTMRSNEGQVTLSGSITAILELGMGFNPDFTGRQNTYHALGLMGRQHSEITSIIDSVLEFSELESYYDQPLRIYSSGMHMRLAFSVATAFRPDILIIDEALSVGDAYFQHKSFEKIREFRKLGTTLILVSHDRTALLSICDRAILLHEGALALDGDPESVLDYYNALLSEQDDQTVDTELLSDGRIQTISGSKKATIEESSLVNIDGVVCDTVNVGDTAILRIKVSANKDIPNLILGYAIKDRFGQTLYGTNTFYSDQRVENVTAGETFLYNISFQVDLGPGTYSVALALVGDESHVGQNYEWRDLAIIFDVVNMNRQIFDGKAYIPSKINITRDK